MKQIRVPYSTTPHVFDCLVKVPPAGTALLVLRGTMPLHVRQVLTVSFAPIWYM